MSRISSLDAGYRTGQLSLYPLAKDDPSQLYNAKNLSDTVLRQSLAYNGKYLIVADTSAFPSSGLLRVGPSNTGEAELIYYGATTPTQFQNLIRGFAGSRQSAWSAGVGV